MAIGQPWALPKSRISSAPCGELGRARHDRGTAPQRRLAGRHLVAHLVDGRRGRADERDTHGGDGAGEVGVLGEEAVAGVDTVRAAAADRVQDRLGVEVALSCALAAERVRLVGEADVVGVAIELGVHGDGLHAEVPSGPDDPHGDLTTVGDQDLLEHECQCWPDGGRECHIVAENGPRRGACRSSPSPVRRTAICSPQRSPARRTARSWSPTTRPPGGAGSTARGTRRRAPTCSCRSSSALPPARSPSHRRQ